MTITLKGCGILPICKKNNNIYILCGINNDGKISDLGGKIEDNENDEECAVREFYEETSGLFMNYNSLLSILKKNKKVIRIISSGNLYKSYIIYTSCIDIEDNYKKILNYVRKNNMQPKKINTKNYNINKILNSNNNYYPYGFFEMQEIKWMPIDEIVTMAKEKNKKLLFRLRSIIYKLIYSK
jgi:ADP-ribose pyrophosphatase YjhB (NUDIX family)